jgi:dephospho-CoA kinase
MKLILIGNVASGKSTIAKLLSEKTGWKVHGIDAYRRRYNQDATEIGERLSWQFYLEAVEKKKNLIIENSGTAQNYELLKHKAGKPRTVILIECPPKECIRRHNARMRQGYRLPPSPWKRPIEQGIVSIATLLELAEYDLIYDSTKMSAEEIVEKIIRFCRLHVLTKSNEN